MCSHRIFATFSSKARQMSLAICLTPLICLSAGCGKHVEYVNSEHRLTRLKTGQPSPREGVLISEGYLSEMYDALGQSRPGLEDSKAAKTPLAETAKVPSAIAPAK